MTRLALLALLLVSPLLLPGYRLYTASTMASFVVVGVGLHLLVGELGLVSLGHAGFVAVGAYASVLVSALGPASWPLGLLAAAVAAAAVGVVVGLPALRLEGPYLAIVTLAFGIATPQVLARLPGLGGHRGLPLPEPGLGPLALSGDAARYYVVLAVALGMVWLARNLSRSRVGRAWRAIDACSDAAVALGVDAGAHKLLGFGVSAAYAGVAGALLALVTGFVSPSGFSVTLSLLFLAMVVVGGLGSVTGAVLGSALFGLLYLEMGALAGLPGLSRVLDAVSSSALPAAGLPSFGWIVTGLLIIGVVVLEPRGLLGIWLRLARPGGGRA